MGRNVLIADKYVLAVAIEVANSLSNATSSSNRSGDVIVVTTRKIINKIAFVIIVELLLLFYINTHRKIRTVANSTPF